MLNSLFGKRRSVTKWLATLERRASSAGVALEDDKGRVLVVKASYKEYWSFPGGIVDPGETPLQAAVRECREEVNLSLDPAALSFRFVVDRVSDIAHTYQFIFTAPLSAELAHAVQRDGKEIEETAFVSREQILSHDRYYSQSTILWAKNFEAGYSEQVFGANAVD